MFLIKVVIFYITFIFKLLVLIFYYHLFLSVFYSIF